MPPVAPALGNTIRLCYAQGFRRAWRVCWGWAVVLIRGLFLRGNPYGRVSLRCVPLGELYLLWVSGALGGLVDKKPTLKPLWLSGVFGGQVDMSPEP